MYKYYIWVMLVLIIVQFNLCKLCHGKKKDCNIILLQIENNSFRNEQYFPDSSNYSDDSNNTSNKNILMNNSASKRELLIGFGFCFIKIHKQSNKPFIWQFKKSFNRRNFIYFFLPPKKDCIGQFVYFNQMEYQHYKPSVTLLKGRNVSKVTLQTNPIGAVAKTVRISLFIYFLPSTSSKM